MAGIKDKARLRPVPLIGALSLFSLFVSVRLFGHPETVLLLFSLPAPAAFACDIRCLGIMPFLQVLGQAGKALLLLFISFSFLYALFRTALRIQRTAVFVDGAERNAVPSGNISRFPFLDDATVFEDRRPLAFTGGFLKPRVFLSTKLLDVLDEKELRAVVLHESRHQRSKDPLKELAVSFLSDFLFFLPVSGFLRKTYHLATEMTADAFSVSSQADPLDLVSSLLKVQKINGPAASWFFDPTTERVRRLLGRPARLPLPLNKVAITVVLLAVTAMIALVPVKKSVSSLFIGHDRTCALRSAHEQGPEAGG